MNKKKLDLQFKSTKTNSNMHNIKGIASVDSVDRDGDVVSIEALEYALKDLQQRGKKQLAMKFMHDRESIIGGFPVDEMEVTEDGLNVVGEINLDTKIGKEVSSLINQGTIEHMSIGFGVDDLEYADDITIFKKIKLYEISLVDEPANLDAKITLKLKNCDDIRSIEKFLKERGLTHQESVTLISKIKKELKKNKSKDKSNFLEEVGRGL